MQVEQRIAFGPILMADSVSFWLAKAARPSASVVQLNKEIAKLEHDIKKVEKASETVHTVTMLSSDYAAIPVSDWGQLPEPGTKVVKADSDASHPDQLEPLPRRTQGKLLRNEHSESL
jgi:hypothetical protein